MFLYILIYNRLVKIKYTVHCGGRLNVLSYFLKYRKLTFELI